MLSFFVPINTFKVHVVIGAKIRRRFYSFIGEICFFGGRI